MCTARELRFSIALPIVVALFTGTGPIATANSLMLETFTDANGTDLENHSPDMNPWPDATPYDSDGAYGFTLDSFEAGDAISGNVLMTASNYGAGIKAEGLADLPDLLAISLDFSIQTATQNEPAQKGHVIGLGFSDMFFGDWKPYPARNLVVKYNGDVYLLQHDVNEYTETLAMSYDSQLLGSWSTTDWYRLSYTIDTSSGDVTSASMIRLTGGSGVQTFDPTTDIFRDVISSNTDTPYAGWWVRVNVPGEFSLVDNFSLIAVPEPSSVTLLAAGLLFVATWPHLRHRRW